MSAPSRDTLADVAAANGASFFGAGTSSKENSARRAA